MSEATVMGADGVDKPVANSALTTPERGPRPHRGRIFMPDPVLRHERYGRWTFRWLLLALLLIPAITIAVNIGVVYALENVAFFRDETARYGEAVKFENIAADNPYSLFMLTLVGIGFAAPVWFVGHLYRNRWWAYLTYDAPFRWYNFVKASSAYLVLMLVGVGYGLLTTPDQYSVTSVLTDPPPAYAMWFGLALLAIFIQSFGEEFLFRGLLPRLLGAVIPLRLIAVGLVMALFISLHAANPDVAIDLKFILILFVITELLYFTILFRTRSISATWGMHWANNSFIFLLLSTEPGRSSSTVPFIYTDKVWTQGGSYLTDPFAYAQLGAGLAILCLLLFWRASPFYLPWHDEEDQ